VINNTVATKADYLMLYMDY